MIDWTKERTEKNYCGYCLNDPTSYCDGHCFIEGNPKELSKRRLDHLKDEMKKTEKRLSDIKNEMNFLVYRSNEND